MNQFLEISNLEKHYSENPESVIFAFLAFRNLEQGNPEKALTVCEKGMKNHPEYPFGHFVLGLCHYHLKNYSKAKTHFEIATAFDDKNPQAWKLLGEINEHLDLPILADECNLKYYLLDSFNPDALEKYQKGEIIDFDVFKRGNEYDFAPPDKSTGEEQKVTEKKEAETIDEHFEENKGLPKSIKRDSFMEKVTQDISRIDEDERAEIFSADSEGDAARAEREEKPEDSKRDAGGLDEKESKSDESIESNLDEEIRRGFEDTSSEGSEELLDFRSVVKDIISENEEESDDTFKDEPVSEKKNRRDEVVRGIFPGEGEKTVEFERPPILTPTIGEIYIAQGRFKEAIDVFEQLLEKEPNNQKFKKKIKDIRLIIEKQDT